MGLQLIFVVETNKKCDSDWIYIKDTLYHFYKCDSPNLKVSPVYMNGKGKYRQKEEEISKLIKKYASTSENNESKVIYCFDCDDYDSKLDDATFLQTAKQYCDEQNAEMVWFCKDIERVYLGKKVADSEKRSEANKFKGKKLIENVDGQKLLANSYQPNTSNLMRILDKYLKRK